MTPVYMPFTYLSPSTARLLAALVGPVVVYQPLENHVAASLDDLASGQLIEIRSPLAGDEERLKAAHAEFIQWAQMNPGKSTPGADFFGSRQGVVPFFDDTTINRIRSEIRRHGTPKEAAGAQESRFSARLFLSVAEANDRASDHLESDLEQFDTLERGFLKSLSDDDEAAFSRHGMGASVWREDPGVRSTPQRVRAWATLAAADRRPAEMMVTTSPAVVEALLDGWEETIGLVKLAAARRFEIPVDQRCLLGPALTDLMMQPSLTSGEPNPFAVLAEAAGDQPAITLTLYAAMDLSPAVAVRRLAPSEVIGDEKIDAPGQPRHTLILLVER